MKVIHEKDYTYIGIDGPWYVFESKPKKDFYPERLMEYAARMIKLDGTSQFFDPMERENCN